MRHYAGSAAMLLVTTAVIVGSYTVNLKVSAERAQVEHLRRTLVADARRIRDLQAELRTRARPPQIQRWNDEVLLMGTPAAGQYLRGATQLASFAVPAEAPPMVRNAVTTPMPAAAAITAPIVRAAYRPAPAAPAGVMAVAYRPALPRPAPAFTVVPEAAAASAPVDLLQQGGQ
jgi:hypothetical protein